MKQVSQLIGLVMSPNTTMSSTNTITSQAINIIEKDEASLQMVWTGTPTGTFFIQGSLDYNPGNVQSGGAPNAGTWTTIPFLDQNGNPPVASGSAGQILSTGKISGIPWLRLQYTNASGSGTLTSASIFTKSLS